MAKKTALPLSRVYRLIEPGPVVMVTTASGARTNIMTMSWHMMIDFEPPLIAFIVGNRGFTFDVLKKTKECVINIPTMELAQQVVACGNVSGRKLDKFAKFGLTPSAATRVQAPLIDECFANLECRVIDAKLAAKYNLFIVEVVKAWIDRSMRNPRTLHHQGYGSFVIDGETIKLPSKMR